MKTMNLVRTLLMAVGMASCTAVSDAPMNHEESTSTLEKNFNARSVNYHAGDKNSPNLSELTPVSVDEANNILNALRSHRNVKVNHAINEKAGEAGQTFLTISTEQQIADSHRLTLQMTMITYADDGSLYYKDYKSFAASDMYMWHMTGFGLASSGSEGMYKIEGTSNLYFKVMDDSLYYIQVPVKVTGTYNPKTHEVNFTYDI